MRPLTIHLIPNAHLDPVWLWDWREGLNEAWQTCRTVLDLMDEFPQLTFIRGEAAVYEHIERHDPATFTRIQRQAKAGRWDVVGGTYIQPDTNLPATETFARHLLRGQRYFRERFGHPVKIAWAADSFGHSAGLPNLLAASGIEGIAFTRTGPVVPREPAFWWESPEGARVLAYRPPVGWYGCERDELPRRLDQIVEHAPKSSLRHVGAFLGLGNHGGGPTRRHIQDALAWAERHPEVRVIWSGLHRLFSALRAEPVTLPVYRGELNYCLRGCYASVAKFKFPYRRAEALLSRAETVTTALAPCLPTLEGGAPSTPVQPLASRSMRKGVAGAPPSTQAAITFCLASAWDTVLFNSFHDILPGSSIERAFDDQIAQVHGVIADTQRVELAALNALAMQVDTTVRPVQGDHPTAIPFLVFNPHPHPYRGPVELETNLDARPLGAYANRPADIPLEVRGPAGQRLPFQPIAHEHLAFPSNPWRKRVIVPVTLPPLGWSVYTLGWVEGATRQATAPYQGTVRARMGAQTIALGGQIRLSAITVEDPYGSWGDMAESAAANDLQRIRHRWKVTQAKVLERGPLSTTTWVQLHGGQSRLELRLTQHRHHPAVEAHVRVLWNERNARLKLVFTGAGSQAEFAVPGGTIQRGPAGEVPGNGWVRAGTLGFASDGLYCFNLKRQTLQATICRASRYACDPMVEDPQHPAVDAGEMKFRFLVTRGRADLPRLARELEQPVLVQQVPAKPGRRPRTGSLLSLSAGFELLALKPAADGAAVVLRARNGTGARRTANIEWLGKMIELGNVKAGEIATWRIARGRAQRTTIVETGFP